MITREEQREAQEYAAAQLARAGIVITPEERDAIELVGRYCTQAVSLARRLRTDLQRLPRGD